MIVSIGDLTYQLCIYLAFVLVFPLIVVIIPIVRNLIEWVPAGLVVSDIQAPLVKAGKPCTFRALEEPFFKGCNALAINIDDTI